MTDRYLPIHYDIFCGMDVSKKRIDAVFLDWQDQSKRVTMPYGAEYILRFAEKNFSKRRIVYVYEAGPTGYGLYDGITEARQKCLVAVPSMIPEAPGKRVKTNQLDAMKLAINVRAGVDLSSGGLKAIHVPSKMYRDLRYLTHWRDVWAKRIRATRCQIKSLFLMEGIPFPETGWNSATLEILQKREYPRESLFYVIEEMVELLKIFRKGLSDSEKRIREFYKRDLELQRCFQYLLSVDGIGPVTATHFLARVGDWRELGTSRQTCGFVGLGPRESSTGDRIRRGEITAVGDRQLRAKIIQCAWRAKRADLQLQMTFDSVRRRNPKQYGSQKAIVAVARKLVARMHAVLKEQRTFQSRIALKQEEAGPRGDPKSPQSDGARLVPEARFCRKGPGEIAP
jgi:transposase